MDTNSPLRLAYLVSRYPDVSHTFILREVLALRERCVHIEVASINNPPETSNLAQQEKGEAAATFYVKAAGAAGALRAMAALLLRHPRGLLRGLGRAWSLSGWCVPRLLLYTAYWAEAVILLRWMAARSLNHLHVHFATPASTVALILSAIAPVSFSLTVHGPDEFYDITQYNLAEKISEARFIVCISFFARSQLMKLSAHNHWSKLDVARLGVDCSHFGPRTPQEDPRAFRILCVGRLVSTKGQRVLLEAVTQLIGRGRPVRLHLIGDGPDRRALESWVAERNLTDQIRFEGSVNQDQIRAHYAAADIFALASFAEGIPVVLMEAMAMEIPCVATSINGIPELIRHGLDGLLVAPSDVEGLCCALSRLIDDPALRASIGKAGRRRVQEHYDLSASADRLATIFRNRLETAN